MKMKMKLSLFMSRIAGQEQEGIYFACEKKKSLRKRWKR